MRHEETEVTAVEQAEATTPKKARKARKDKGMKSKSRAKAKAKRAKGNEERLINADLDRYTVDKEVKTASGRASIDIGDTVAERLRGKELADVYAIVAKALDVEEKELVKQFSHLNPGMIRMNLGNRYRAALRAKEQGDKPKVKRAKKAK
jgi:hypothetical protein